MKQAYDRYLKFRGLIADTMFTFKERTESRSFFIDKIEDGKEALKIIQIELNFLYDVFFTKVNTLQKAHGLTRVFSLLSVTASLLLFYKKNTHNESMVNLRITYALLGGALFMEVVSLVMLAFSDWAVVVTVERSTRFVKAPFSATLLEFWLKHRPPRWSEKISQYDLLYYCLNDHSSLLDILLLKRIKDEAEDLLYVYRCDFDYNMGNLIFTELKKKAIIADRTEDAKKAC